jgi:hypothetical protein
MNKALSVETNIYNIIKEYDIDIINDSQKLSALIADYFPHDPKLKNHLVISVNNKIPVSIYDILKNGKKDSYIHFKQLKQRVLEDVYFNNTEFTDRILGIWTNALLTISEERNYISKQDFQTLTDLLKESSNKVSSSNQRKSYDYRETLTVEKSDNINKKNQNKRKDQTNLIDSNDLKKNKSIEEANICYSEGKYKESLKIYNLYKSEDLNEQALYNLGEMNENGRGIPKNRLQAISWYKKAAEKGNKKSMLRLARMYIIRGSVTDIENAVNWLKKELLSNNLNKADKREFEVLYAELKKQQNIIIEFEKQRQEKEQEIIRQKNEQEQERKKEEQENKRSQSTNDNKSSAKIISNLFKGLLVGFGIGVVGGIIIGIVAALVSFIMHGRDYYSNKAFFITLFVSIILGIIAFRDK